MHHDVTILVQDANVHAPGVQVDATIILVLMGVESHEILCRRTRHTRAAGVKLLQTSVTRWAEPRKKESKDGDTSGDLQGSGNATATDPVSGL
jgi:hypothetical protein